MKGLVRALMVALAVTVGFSMAAHAQTAKKTKGEVALGEYCPVAYAAMGKAVKGDPKYSSTFGGKTYYLLNADAKKMFDAAPATYLPRYDGYCPTALAMGKKMQSDPALFEVRDGATYLFSSDDAKAAFDKDPAHTITMADRQFASLTKQK